LAARPLVQQIAESGNPIFAVMRRRTEHRIGDAGPENRSSGASPLNFSTQKSNGQVSCGSIRTVTIPARPNIAATVEPARSLPTIAISVYFIEHPDAETPSLCPESVKRLVLGREAGLATRGEPILPG
jgi:hypothetical protein